MMGARTTSRLNPAHTRALVDSGIPIEIAVAAGLRSGSEREIQLLLDRKDPVGAGLIIPYPDPINGGVLKGKGRKDTSTFEFLRVRLDDPAQAPDQDGKVPKYLSRAGSGQQPYILPEVARLISAGERTIYITEGEKKALAGYSNGLPVIGLSGNYGWKVKDKQELLPLLAQFLSPGTTVVAIWDSDAALNSGFAASTRMLHDILRRRSCAMKVAVLPQSDVTKVGLDDFLVANGKDAFLKLVNSTAVLPGDKQVTVSSLILEWSKSLTPAVRSLPAERLQRLLRHEFVKGLIDSVEHGARREILSHLQSCTTVDIGAIFRECIQEYLISNYGAAADAHPKATGVAGQVATLTGETPRRVKVISVEEKFAWVCEVKRKDVSFPVPTSALGDFTDDAADRETPARIADVMAREVYTHDEVLTLRYYRDAFFAWYSGVYKEIPETDIRSRVMGFIRRASQALALPSVQAAVLGNLKADGVCHLASAIQPPFMIDKAGKLTATPSIISFSNGNLDVAALANREDDSLIWTPPTPLLFTTAGRNYAFDSEAVCPKWVAFLDEALPNAELRALFQEIVGYLQIVDTSMQRFFLLFGPGANGKGVGSDVIAAVVGTGNVSAIPLARFGERFALWPLTQCLVNLVAEMPGVEHGQARLAEDKLKAIVSGDLIEVERKNKDIVRARPTARLIFSCNELPPVSDRSQGVWRRMIIVPFNVVIPPERQNPALAQEIIREELPGVFNWALEGLLRLRARGRFLEPEVCQQLKAQHRLACAPEEEFLREHVTAGSDADFVVFSEIYTAYRTYVSGNGGHPIGARRFTDSFCRLFPGCKDERRTMPEKGRTRGYSGAVFHRDGAPEGAK